VCTGPAEPTHRTRVDPGRLGRDLTLVDIEHTRRYATRKLYQGDWSRERPRACGCATIHREWRDRFDNGASANRCAAGASPICLTLKWIVASAEVIVLVRRGITEFCSVSTAPDLAADLLNSRRARQALQIVIQTAPFSPCAGSTAPRSQRVALAQRSRGATFAINLVIAFLPLAILGSHLVTRSRRTCSSPA